MKFSSKRRQREEINRRRPVSTERDRSRAFSYYANRTPGESSAGRTSPQQIVELRRRRHNWRSVIRQAPLIAATVVVVVCALSELSLNTGAPKIVPLSSSGSQVFLRSTDTYQRAAAKLFSRSWGDRNKLTVDTGSISRSLEQEFPEISSVSIALPILGHDPVVYIQPVEPALVLHTVNGAFVIDSNGRALVAASTVSPQLSSLSMPNVTDQTGIQANVGDTVLPSTDATFIHTVAAQLSAQHVVVSKIVLPPAASELDVYIAGTPYYVKFNLQNDPLQQVGTFVAVRQHFVSAHSSPAQYVDVRIDGRAYYK